MRTRAKDFAGQVITFILPSNLANIVLSSVRISVFVNLNVCHQPLVSGGFYSTQHDILGV